jgi:prevent-host-death family protein
MLTGVDERFRLVVDQSEIETMSEVGAYEAKTHLPKLLERVTAGERITITRHGVPVAYLVPVSGSQRRPLAQTIRELREFRRGRRLDGTVRELIEEGRS